MWPEFVAWVMAPKPALGARTRQGSASGAGVTGVQDAPVVEPAEVELATDEVVEPELPAVEVVELEPVAVELELDAEPAVAPPAEAPELEEEVPAAEVLPALDDAEDAADEGA